MLDNEEAKQKGKSIQVEVRLEKLGLLNRTSSCREWLGPVREMQPGDAAEVLYVVREEGQAVGVRRRRDEQVEVFDE